MFFKSELLVFLDRLAQITSKLLMSLFSCGRSFERGIRSQPLFFKERQKKSDKSENRSQLLFNMSDIERKSKERKSEKAIERKAKERISNPEKNIPNSPLFFRVYTVLSP